MPVVDQSSPVTDVQQAVPVAQIDREAAANLEQLIRGGRLASEMRDGSFDKGHTVQAFALHRLASLPCKSGEGAEMTAEEHRLEDLKQMAAYAGPVVSFEVREPYYLASCDHCGWVGSSEHCGSDTGFDDSDVYCPRCQSSGADCGKVANYNPPFNLTRAPIPDATQTREAELVAALTMPNGDVLTPNYPGDDNWAKSWTSRDTKGRVATQEQDWEIVESYGLTALFAAFRAALNARGGA